MIKDNLTTQIQEAMKAGDEIRVSTLKLLSNAIHNEKIAKQRDLTSEEELQIVRRQFKQREEAIELYKKGGRQELVDKETAELAVLKEFLPVQISEGEIAKIVGEVIAETCASGASDFGKVMGEVMGRLKGQASGDVVAEVVRKRLD